MIDVSISLDEPSLGAAFDESPVDVEIVSNAVLGALAVPVNALLALAEGGYALEVERVGSLSWSPSIRGSSWTDLSRCRVTSLPAT